MPRDRVSLRTTLQAGPPVDRELGVIRRVPIITAGITKPSGGGHGSFDVDATTLSQVADAINAQSKVRSRITHPEVEGVDGIDRRVGYFRNATIEGSKVYADFYFGSYASADSRTLLCGLVEEEPEDIGVSIVSESATIEPAPNTQTGFVLRLSELDSIDWTDDPAANPAGMLSAQRRHRRTVQLQIGDSTMEYNEKQLEYLHGLGLPAEATPEAIAEFVMGLTPEQAAGLEALASATVATNDPTKPDDQIAAMEDDETKPVAANTLTDENLVADEDVEVPAPGQTPAPATTTVGPKQLSAAIAADRKAERARVREINAIALKCGFNRKWVDTHIDNDTPIAEVRRVALAGLKREPSDMPSTSVKVGADHNRDTLNQAVQDAIMLRAGVRNFTRFDADGRVILSAGKRPEQRQAHQRANEFRGHSVIEMGRRYLVALGYHAAERMNRTQLATLLMSRTQLMGTLSGVYLAHATGDFPYLLADSMGKVLRSEYALAPHTWNMWARSTTAPDYKDIKKLQLSEAADLEAIPEGDEYTYAALSESRETYALSKYGKGLKFTREMLINDDLSAFDRVPRMMGRAAARKVEGLAIAVLTANANLADAVALFATAHANLTTGALTVASLGSARALLRKQTALGSDDPLELTPKYLLVPETIATTAQQLVSSTVDPAKNNATPNPFSNTLEVIPSARLDSDSTTQWYLLADPSEIDTVEIAFLEGEETPVVEEEDEFDSDVRKVKVRHNIAAKAIDYRGMVRSSGS